LSMTRHSLNVLKALWLFDVSGGNPQSNPALRDYPSQHFGLLPAPVCSPKPRFKMFIAAFLSLDILSQQGIAVPAYLLWPSVQPWICIVEVSSAHLLTSLPCGIDSRSIRRGWSIHQLQIISPLLYILVPGSICRMISNDL
jgi:hypothetical protein